MKLLTGVIATGFGTLFTFALGFSFRDIENAQVPSKTAFERIFQSVPPESPKQGVLDTFDLISTKYQYKTDVKKLKYSAISGQMASVGDPHTTFLVPQVKKNFDYVTSANFFGIGCELKTLPVGVLLDKVFDGSPASKAGLKVGDVIVNVNGEKIAGRTSDQIVNKIRGPKDTSVELGVLIKGHLPVKNVQVIREEVSAPTVIPHYFKDQKIGYVALTAFAHPTVDQFVKEVDTLREQPMKGLIIDLRENPGGLLEAACNLLGCFAEDKIVVRMRHRDGSEEIARSPSGHLLNLNVPIVILINKDSASAAEIFSGCMKDYGLATLVGTHSYGKASVQTLFPMIDNAGVKVTIARYYLPFTADISRKVDADGHYLSGGLKPDFEVENSPTAFGAPFDLSQDRQLAKAIEVLASK